MRVSSDLQQIECEPGGHCSIVVDVVNTGAVIDGVTARVIGLPEEFVSAHPQLLPLFPDAGGQITVTLTIPPAFPAGRHRFTVEVVSHGAREPSQFLDADLIVSARPALRLASPTRVVRARRSARFVLQLANQGNVALDTTLRSVDADRASTTRLTPANVRIEAGATVPVLLEIRGPRMFTGAEIDRSVTVGAEARAADQDLGWAATEPDPGAPSGSGAPTDGRPEPQETSVRLRQRPTISRGLLTALILASIVALWAGVFLLGLSKVFSNDPMTKEAPASFFAAAKTTNLVANSTGGGAPAGALPKSGQLPPGVGGIVSGTVTAATDGQPVGRILVQALRQTPKGLVAVSSAATQSDGTYTLAGLFPTDYLIEFTAAGFTPVWYPAAGSSSGASSVSVGAQGTTSGVNAVITGKPASISGAVDPGATLSPVTTTVVARPLTGARAGQPAATAKTDGSGKYVLTGLPAPGTYELSFTAPGYQASTLVDSVNGGDQRLEPTITLGASLGQISGTVTGGGQPLGGVTISTTIGGTASTIMTPTTGQVGSFVIGNLPTPATYVLTFTAKGYGTQTQIVDLAAGQTHAGLDPDLAAGTGSISGTLVDSAGHGLGGATVTVGGAAISGGSAAAGTTPSTGSSSSSTAPATATGQPSTVTLSNGAVGSFAINGLTAPGSYTLTFTLTGYAPTTVPVQLSGTGPPPSVTVTLVASLGNISGVITDGAGAAFVGATVTATNGAQSWTVTSSNAGDGLATGGYLITGLQPGSYSVTVTAAGHAQQTALVFVTAGKTASQSLQLGG